MVSNHSPHFFLKVTLTEDNDLHILQTSSFGHALELLEREFDVYRPLEESAESAAVGGCNNILYFPVWHVCVGADDGVQVGETTHAF